MKGTFLGTVFMLCLYAFLIVGYVKNIVKLTKCDFKEPYKAEVIHIVGAVSGVGSILGHFDFGK